MTADAPSADIATSDRRSGKTFFGHPRGLAFLFGTEMWERFAFYGMLAFFILYMVNYLFIPGRVERVVGYGAIKAGFESAFGPLGIQALASQIYGLYIGFAYLAPFFGGLLADRVLGQRRTVAIGATLLATGYFLMSFERLFFIAFPVIILGNGCFKPNISTQIGNLYPAGDDRRDRAFSLFYIGINIGGFFGPLVCGTLGERGSWRYGFLAASIGMLAALAIYLYGLRFAPPDALGKARAAHIERAPLNAQEKQRIWALVLVVAISILFWAAWYQQFDTMNLWADKNTDRDIALLGWRFTIPTTWFQTVNGLFIFILTPIITGIWARQARKDREPSTVMKLAIGCGLLGLSFVLMLGAVAEAGVAGKASWVWLFGFYLLYTAGELYLSPVGLSLVTKVSPARMVSMMMGVWFLAAFVGGYASGWLGGFWEILPKGAFFSLMGAICFVAAIALAALNRRLKSALNV